MHNISTNTLLFCAIGSLEESIRILKENGFKDYDLSLSFIVEQCDTFIDKKDYIKRAKKFKKYSDSIGMNCNQCHSFMKVMNKKLTKEENDYLFLMAKRSIAVAGIMNCPYIVMHPYCDCTLEENIQIFKELLKVAHKYNTTICVENMPTGFFSEPASINALLDQINDKNIGLCLDIGHAEIQKSPKSSSIDIIENCYKYLKCLHIDDNDKINDDHLLPYTSKIDFDSIWECLKKHHYQGDITFEADGYFWPQKMEDRIKCLPSLYKLGELIKSRLAD